MSASRYKVVKDHDALSRALDFGCLLVAFAATSSLLSGSDLFVWPKPTSSDIAGWPAQYVVLLLSTLIAWSVVSGYLGTPTAQQSNVVSRGHFWRFIRAVPLWLAAIALAIFLFKLREVSRLFVLSYVALTSALITLRDLGETMTERWIYQTTGMHRTAVIIGTGPQANWLRRFLLDNYCPDPYTLVRQVDPADPDYIHEEAMTDASGHRPFSHSTEVFVAAADVGTDVSALFPRLFEAGTEAHIVPAIFDTSIFKLTLRNMGGIPMITLRAGALSGVETKLKRALDLAVTVPLLIIAAPIMALIAILVKVSSPGPVFFRQERVGKGGREIQIYKFRTMHRDAEHILHSDRDLYRTYVENNYKLPRGRDPRITLIGQMLRRLSLDEIPQLINVLKGEMSLVGPRPVIPAEIDKYGDYASLLLSVQPGLTGQWQVSGRSDIGDYAQRVQLDMEYIRDQSILRDLRILFRTLPVVLSGDGAH